MDAETKTILVVDDDALNRQLVARILARAGFMTASASNGEEAWERILPGQFNAVISDGGCRA